MEYGLIKIFVSVFASFWVGIAISPFLTGLMYRYRLWKKKPRNVDNDSEISDEFSRIHNTSGEVSTPRVGGVVMWFTVLVVAMIFYLLRDVLVVGGESLNFISRSTYLLLVSFFGGALIGLVDDMLQVVDWGNMAFKDGFSGVDFFLVVCLFGLIMGWWFFDKLGYQYLDVPFVGDVFVGAWIIPIFAIVSLWVFSFGVIDGIDGLSGGVFATVFGAFGVIALMGGQIDVATFAFVVVAGLLVFLWFNIPPARFYMGETGMLALTFSLPVLAFLTDSVFLLPIIAFVLVVTMMSSLIQIVSKRIWGPDKGKVFKVAPLHHHFQYIGWGNDKIVMRYWILSMVFASLGVLLALF